MPPGHNRRYPERNKKSAIGADDDLDEVRADGRGSVGRVGVGGVPLPFSPAAAAEKWDLYVYNAVATVSAVKGLNVVIEQIEKETGGELTIRLHLGGSLPINTTNITQAVSDDVVQMGDDGYFLGNVPIGGVLRLPMLIRTPRRISEGRGDHRRPIWKRRSRRRASSCSASISIPPGRVFEQEADLAGRLSRARRSA